MIYEIVAIYAIVEDLLKAIGHQEDCRIEMSDAEVITAALVAARFFNGNQFERLSIFTRTWLDAQNAM